MPRLSGECDHHAHGVDVIALQDGQLDVRAETIDEHERAIHPLNGLVQRYEDEREAYPQKAPAAAARLGGDDEAAAEQEGQLAVAMMQQAVGAYRSAGEKQIELIRHLRVLRRTETSPD